MPGLPLLVVACVGLVINLISFRLLAAGAKESLNLKGAYFEVLADMRPAPVPVSLLYPHHSFLSPAMRAFVDWTTELFSNAG